MYTNAKSGNANWKTQCIRYQWDIFKKQIDRHLLHRKYCQHSLAHATNANIFTCIEFWLYLRNYRHTAFSWTTRIDFPDQLSPQSMNNVAECLNICGWELPKICDWEVYSSNLSTQASYLELPLWLFFKKNLRYYLEICHNSFLPHSFQFTVHYHPTSQSSWNESLNNPRINYAPQPISHSRWCTGYRTCHCTQGSLIQTRTRVMDF